MASMDSCLRLLEDRGEALCAAWARRLAEFDRQIQGLRHLRCPGHGAAAGEAIPGVFAWDPTKILISTRDSALTGVELKDRLREEYHIEVEMALDHYAVAMTGLGNGDDMPARLAQALLALDREAGPRQGEPLPPAEPYTLPPPEAGAGGGRHGPRGPHLPLRRHGEGVWGSTSGPIPPASPW